ncbi:MAG: hypothetical protein J5533_08320 [Bacteroidales bacterium]|nr:hypothetical protein [Bacteroidales bacterium]
MKRIIILMSALVAFSVGATAQDSYFGELLSKNNYYGTARSISLGGAMTALGGDLGSITFNPAGSVVNDYCQFTISPGLIFTSTGASYDPTGMENFSGFNRVGHTKGALPNLGLNLVFYPEASSWITSTSFGFIVNTTNNYASFSTGMGVNPSTSFLGGMAAAANGLSYNDMPLNLKVSYNANQLGEYGPEGSLRYVGGNQTLSPDETRIYVPGDLNQTAIYNTWGTKKDYITNIGFNVDDAFYFGFNLGFTGINYRREELFSEAAVMPEQFPTIMFDENNNLVSTNYVSSTNGYKLNSDAVGIYAKFGFIWLPTESLRIGAAIQTPTSYTIEEEWGYTATTSYDVSKFDGQYSDSSSDSYNFRSPYVFNAGIAYTVPGVGLLSLDYELTDYSVMKYSYGDLNFLANDPWSETNYVNRTFCGTSHAVRAGVEFKPLPSLALRAGYSFVSDPEKWFTDKDGKRVNAETWQGYNQILTYGGHFDSYTHAVSAGLGYSSPGSFFADLALRATFNPMTQFNPYYYGYDAYDKNGSLVAALSPIEALDRRVIDVVATFGWRF